MFNRPLIRKQLREHRASLSHETLLSHSQSAAKLFLESDLYQQAKRIGFYMAHHGEIDPSPVLDKAMDDDKLCYLPTLDPLSEHQLIFVHYKKDTSLVKNRYNIPEPTISPDNVIDAKSLDLVLVPMVSFDCSGNRLGMGKGYYDRTFAYKNNIEEPAKPILVGYAHEFQKSPSFTHKSWDVPMDFVVTEANIYQF